MLNVERECRDEDARALFELTAELADKELSPAVAAAEHGAVFPRDAFKLIGLAGLLGLPYPESLGGGGQPYETYL
jgi:alkylation response protein AidB-like acyl-CoA dehydrogenase